MHIILYICDPSIYRYNFKRDSHLQRQARSLAYSENCEQNQRYVAAGEPPPSSQRQLPLLPLCVNNNTLTFSNPVAAVKDGACANGISSHINSDCDHTYDTAQLCNSKVANPLYQDMAETTTTELQKKKSAVSVYENIGPLEKQPTDGEYVVMKSTAPGSEPAGQYETAR